MLTKYLKVVGLISGGKDSCYNMIQCVSEGHKIVALANLRPKHKDEVDSHMFQTVGHHIIGLYVEALGVPLYRRTLEGSSVAIGADYHITKDDEVEDLYELLKEVKEKEDVNAVSVGAILSDYQRVRIENVCMRLGLTPLSYLWRRNQAELLREMIGVGVESILIKVAAIGLEPQKHLGQTIAQILPHMVEMEEKYGLNVCGEGGEYETFTLDCPLFKKRIVIDKKELVIHSDDAFSPVGYLNLLEAHLEDKQGPEPSIEELQIQRSSDLLEMLLPAGSENAATVVMGEEPVNTPVAALTPPATAEAYIKGLQTDAGHFWVTDVMGWITEGQCVKTMTANAMDTLAGRLASMDVDFKDVALMQLYVGNMDDFASINEVYKTYFSINPPARVCLQVPLPSNVGVRIACYGYGPTESIDKQVPRRTMHVQGLSHWAPANIGPYSQAVMLGDTMYVAGQIGMLPSSLDLAPGLVAQCRLSLRHVGQILTAFSSNTRMHNIIVGVCYVTRKAHIDTAVKEFNMVLTASMNEGAEKSDSLTPVLQYVVVPRLPKGALVEWQVYAAHVEGLLAGRMQKRLEGLTSTLIYKWLPAPSAQLSFMMEIHRDLGSNSQSVAYVDACKLICNSLASVSDELNIESQLKDGNKLHNRYAQIFYMPGSVNEDVLRQCFHKTASSRKYLPVPVFVPVVSFMSDTMVMGICC